jgi:hypothetical protein
LVFHDDALETDVANTPQPGQIQMTPAEREVQRLNFAYGTLRIENPRITRAIVRAAAERLKQRQLEQKQADEQGK